MSKTYLKSDHFNGADHVANDEIMEARFKDRDIATVQGRDPFNLINADHVVAKIGKTSTRDKSDA
jgi:hypothetical protein